MSPLLLYIAMAGLYLCLLLPFVRLRTVSVPAGVTVDAVAMQAGVAAPAIGVSAGPPAAISWQEIFLALYLAGALLTLALFLVSASPKWEPGKHNGKAVSVVYTFPVVFKIQ